MPEMDGFEATRSIRAQERSSGGRPTPIIGITASALPADRQACLAAGMDDVLVKPFGPQEFVDMMARWCEPVAGAPKPAANDPGTGSTAFEVRKSNAASGTPRRHDLLGVLLGFQQLGRRFVDGEMGTDDFLLEACRRIAEAMSCHDVIIWTFAEVDDRPALSPLASYERQSDTLRADTQPRLGRTAGWRRLIEDGYQLPGDDLQDCDMLEVVYEVNAEPLGVLACGRHMNGGAWTHEQVQLLRRIASRLGVALLRAMDSTLGNRQLPGLSLVICEPSTR